MAPRFIGKTSLAGLHPVQLGGQPVLASYARLRDLLQARLGPMVAGLFAEPVVTWPSTEGPGSVSWYTDANGDGEPLAGLPADRRAPAEARLRDILQQLGPLLDEPETGPLLRRALALGSRDGALAVGNMPVLTDWGLAADGAGSEDEIAARASAWTQNYASARPPTAPLPAAAVPPAPPTRIVAPPAPMSRPVWDWALIPAAVVIAALFLGIGLYAGARMVAARVAERPNSVALLNEPATREAMDRQREQNAALEREIEARRRLLAGNVCVSDPAQLPRLGPDRAAVVPPGAVVPPAGGQAFQGSLADLLTQAVVLVIAPGSGPDDGVSTGSGFFVAPDLIATNRHVIEGADSNDILVTSKKLGRTTRARVVAQTPSSEIGGPDIALLRVEGATGIQPLAFSTDGGTAGPGDRGRVPGTADAVRRGVRPAQARRCVGGAGADPDRWADQRDPVGSGGHEDHAAQRRGFGRQQRRAARGCVRPGAGDQHLHHGEPRAGGARELCAEVGRDRGVHPAERHRGRGPDRSVHARHAGCARGSHAPDCAPNSSACRAALILNLGPAWPTSL